MWYFILGAVVAWLVFSHLAKKKAGGDSAGIGLALNRNITEDKIQERVLSFEKFSVYSTVPTALYANKRAAYFLMKEWFIRLDERNSHDAEKQQQIRQDWLTYLYQLDHGETSHYLYMESDDKEASRDHQNDARESAIRIDEIENRFAAMVGPEADIKLKEIRDKEFGEWMKEEHDWTEYLDLERAKRKEKENENKAD